MVVSQFIIILFQLNNIHYEEPVTAPHLFEDEQIIFQGKRK